MSAESQEPVEMGTKPINEHAWLQQLVGEWRTESEMMMEQGAPSFKSTGKATTSNLGGLWAVTEAQEAMPNGMVGSSHFFLGYDVSFKEYRGCWISSVSSHLWKYTGELSDDSKVMTLLCEGPSMEVDGETAMYRDVIELIDENHRSHSSYGQDEKGEWHLFMKTDYYRA